MAKKWHKETQKPAKNRLPGSETHVVQGLPAGDVPDWHGFCFAPHKCSVNLETKNPKRSTPNTNYLRLFALSMAPVWP